MIRRKCRVGRESIKQARGAGKEKRHKINVVAACLVTSLESPLQSPSARSSGTSTGDDRLMERARCLRAGS